MDEGLKHEKTERSKHPSLRQANQWESGDSDTESLAQERAYQQQLQNRLGHHDQNKHMLPQQENAASLQQGDGEHEYANDEEDLQVYDSLEVASNPHARRKPTPQTEYMDTQVDERERSRPLSDEAYADLRYDPNWRTNLKGNERFTENPLISSEEYYQVPEENFGQSYGDTQGLKKKGAYRHILDASPAVMLSPHMAGSESDQPYCLHPQDGLSCSGTSMPCPSHALHSRLPEADATEFQTHYQQPLGCTQGEPIQDTSTPMLTSLKVISNKKPERPMEDIVERNKTTLGRNTSKCGSYVRAHSLKQEMPHNVIEVHESLKEATTAENQEGSSDPELRWLQKTQQLRVTQMSKGKKAQRKEYPNLSRQQPPPALAVKAVQGDSRPAAVSQPKPQNMTSSQPLPPTIHLNISLNTSSHLLSLLPQKGQDAIINLASLHGRSHWSPTSEVQLALYPEYQQTNSGKSSHVSREGLNAQLHQRNLESCPEQWRRATALQWPLSCDGEDQTWSLNEVHTKLFPQNLPRTPTTASSRGLGSYALLPPIRKRMTGKEPKISPSQSANTFNPIHRSGSDSYLVQMEKQKQLRARATNKAYKQLNTDINLRGLHPDDTAIEKTKMKRQKLYSNVIREQNKKISRIPFLPAKDPEGSDKKVPRMKALEYAKTIAKPPVLSQPKQRQKAQSEGLTEHAPYLQGLDVAQLEFLRKRHEEEKQAVSLLRKAHAV
ncbi:jhy protein homolog isoform X2 [Trachinotus anak]|uniref:jhy protein homolog isoform X2 n=1 Tax=Trachinotus anak TaxID=443729 RepID=UPI0039F24DD2